MGDLIQRYSERLRALRTDSDADIRDQTVKTLIAIHDASVVAVVAEKCKPLETGFEANHFQSRECIRDVAAFGSNGRSAGPALMPFLQSVDGELLTMAIQALGYIGYDDAVPTLTESLRSHDWRVVHASARSLGWLGATQAIPDLEQVAASHWLPEVKDEALAVLDTLRSAPTKSTRPAFFNVGKRRYCTSYPDCHSLLGAPQCPSRQWEWQGHPISLPQSTRYRRVLLTLDDGVLVGFDMGEWGGRLTWTGAEGQTELIIDDNVIAVEPADGGAMVLFGYAHMGLTYGYAAHVSKGAYGNWALKEVARLPYNAEALATIGPNLFAAWSNGRVAVFSDKEVLGLASCIP